MSVAALEGVAGFVEDPSCYPYLSGLDNWKLLPPRSTARARRRGSTRSLEIGRAQRSREGQGQGLSHEWTAAGIAAELLRNPRPARLDEPATGLDPAGMATCEC